MGLATPFQALTIGLYDKCGVNIDIRCRWNRNNRKVGCRQLRHALYEELEHALQACEAGVCLATWSWKNNHFVGIWNNLENMICQEVNGRCRALNNQPNGPALIDPICTPDLVSADEESKNRLCNILSENSWLYAPIGHHWGCLHTCKSIAYNCKKGQYVPSEAPIS